MPTLRHLLVIVILFSAALPVSAQDAAAPVPVAPAAVLVAGPVALPLPAFADAERAGVKLDDLFGELPALPGTAWPAEGRAFAGPQGKLAWSTAPAAMFPAPTTGAAAAWTALYVASERWQKARLTVISARPVKGSLDGEALSLAKGEGDTLTADLELPTGKHLVVLRSLFDPATEGDWTLAVSLTPDAEAGAGSLALGTAPARATDINLVLEAPRCSDLALSPDGTLVALSLAEIRDGKNRESWVELRATADGKLVDVWRGDGAPSGLRWLDSGNRISWRTDTDDKATIWLRDLDAGTVTAAVEGVQKMGSWRWAPDGSYVIYEVRREPDADKRKVKRVLNPADRQGWYRNRNHLVQAFVPDGVTRRLTAGPVSPDSWRIAPDGKSLLFFLSEQDLTARPYFTSALWLMDLGTLATEQLLDERWIGGAEFSPDGRTLLLSGSVSAFDGLGRDLPEGMQANDYGGQLYLWSLAERQPVFITGNLRPDVSSVAWCAADGMIYARCTDTMFENVYRLKPGKKDAAWQKVETGFGCTDELALPRKGSTAVARGTDATTPNRVHTLDLKTGKVKLLLDPGAAAYEDVAFGRSEPWTAVLPNGESIDGRIWYPPGFDPASKYPLIVYYYGGTSPIDVSFGGRYPKNVWAGQGYVVYTPNPSRRHRLRPGVRRPPRQRLGPPHGHGGDREHQGLPGRPPLGRRRGRRLHGRQLRRLPDRVRDHPDRPVRRRHQPRGHLVHQQLLGRGAVGLRLRGARPGRRLPLERPRPLRGAERPLPGGQDHHAAAAGARRQRHQRARGRERPTVHGAEAAGARGGVRADPGSGPLGRRPRPAHRLERHHPGLPGPAPEEAAPVVGGAASAARGLALGRSAAAPEKQKGRRLQAPPRCVSRENRTSGTAP